MEGARVDSGELCEGDIWDHYGFFGGDRGVRK